MGSGEVFSINDDSCDKVDEWEDLDESYVSPSSKVTTVAAVNHLYGYSADLQGKLCHAHIDKEKPEKVEKLPHLLLPLTSQ